MDLKHPLTSDPLRKLLLININYVLDELLIESQYMISIKSNETKFCKKYIESIDIIYTNSSK